MQAIGFVILILIGGTWVVVDKADKEIGHKAYLQRHANDPK
jgi:hypothetical protein